MKKGFLLFLMVTIVLIAGCTLERGSNPTPPQNQQAPQEGSGSQPSPSTHPSPSPDVSQFIGEDKAKEIALEKAGIPADGVCFDRVELDFDNSFWQYEVEFKLGAVEYEADIKADDGTILSFSVDTD